VTASSGSSPARAAALFGTSCGTSEAENAVQAAEAFADGLITKAALKRARQAAGWFRTRGFEGNSPSGVMTDPCQAAAVTAYWLTHDPLYPHGLKATLSWLGTVRQLVSAKESEGLRRESDLLREVVGNPFRPVAFDSRWRTPNALRVARASYEERAFGRLPPLAGALMHAGCDSEDILAHCRSAGPHVRGCWVVDQVLGKE
jgi:hypothetical protein